MRTNSRKTWRINATIYLSCWLRISRRGSRAVVYQYEAIRNGWHKDLQRFITAPRNKDVTSPVDFMIRPGGWKAGGASVSDSSIFPPANDSRGPPTTPLSAVFVPTERRGRGFRSSWVAPGWKRWQSSVVAHKLTATGFANKATLALKLQLHLCDYRKSDWSPIRINRLQTTKKTELMFSANSRERYTWISIPDAHFLVIDTVSA